jgi:hypothetical protein
MPFMGVAPVIAAPPPVAGFNPNLLIKESSSTGEPSIRTDRFGRPFIIAPTGVPAGCKAFRVTHNGSSSTFLGFPDATAGGGDCDWAIGPQETSATILPTPTDDNLAYSSLTLANITTGKSSDGGNTFTPPNPYSQQVAGDDRMWMAADPKLNPLGFDNVFMTYHDVTAGDIQLGISVDGGRSYVQSGPIINNTDVPATQWGNANELGNIVSYRPTPASPLTLYSIFSTPDSAADNAAQTLAGTTNFNRVYEAVGAVNDATSPPTISWRNYPVYQAPLGTRTNKIFPVTVVDGTGMVYAIWTDGKHVNEKSTLTPAGAGAWGTVATNGTQVDNGTNTTTLMPWAAAGPLGVDVVWYGATGGAAGNNDDPANQWNAYMGQTIDGGASWTTSKASDHVIHTGSICIDGLACNTSTPARNRTLLDFFQDSIDPTNGAADISFTDDHAAPGTGNTYFTRQCTGTSLTTGLALNNDCLAPPPPVVVQAGTTCPGPQITDATGDAPNNFIGGDGSNMDNLDIVSASFATPADTSRLQVTLQLNNLHVPPPPTNLTSVIWRVYWTYGPAGTTVYAAEATNTGPTITYRDGIYDGTRLTSAHTITGSFNAGPNGTVVWQVPLADVGAPATGTRVTKTYADTHGSLNAVFYTAAADRAPDSNYGADWFMGRTCSAVVPEAPSVPLLLLFPLLILALVQPRTRQLMMSPWRRAQGQRPRA